MRCFFDVQLFLFNFQNHVFLILYLRLLCYLRFSCLNTKIDIIRARYEVFHLLTRSHVCIPYLWHKFAFLFMPHVPTFKITFVRFYIIDCSISFYFPVCSLFPVQVCLLDIQNHVFQILYCRLLP